jgi:hypothetical protein
MYAIKICAAVLCASHSRHWFDLVRLGATGCDWVRLAERDPTTSAALLFLNTPQVKSLFYCIFPVWRFGGGALIANLCVRVFLKDLVG